MSQPVTYSVWGSGTRDGRFRGATTATGRSCSTRATCQCILSFPAHTRLQTCSRTRGHAQPKPGVRMGAIVIRAIRYKAPKVIHNAFEGGRAQREAEEKAAQARMQVHHRNQNHRLWHSRDHLHYIRSRKRLKDNRQQATPPMRPPLLPRQKFSPS